MKNMETNENGWVEQLLEQIEIDHKTETYANIHDFNKLPSEDVMQRSEVSLAQKHLLFAFKQFISYSEGSTKYVFDEDYHSYLNHITDWTVLKEFLDYMKGYVEGVEEDCDDPYTLSFNDPDEE